MDKIREEFEKYQIKEGSGLFLTEVNDTYYYPFMQDRWNLWQTAYKAGIQSAYNAELTGQALVSLNIIRSYVEIAKCSPAEADLYQHFFRHIENIIKALEVKYGRA